jgi:hypothetical protein
MTEPIKIKVDFDSETTQALLNFISDTQKGKYTEKKPDLTQITYKRLQIQEQDTSHFVDDNNNEVLLFGVSY